MIEDCLCSLDETDYAMLGHYRFRPWAGSDLESLREQVQRAVGGSGHHRIHGPSVLLANSRCASSTIGELGVVTSMSKIGECIEEPKRERCPYLHNSLNQMKFQHLVF
jgi:hypothetical protein